MFMPKKQTPRDSLLVPAAFIERRIYHIRGQKVMLDSDLADLYQVTTGNLNLAVRRNLDRFPKDFMQPGGVQELEIANCNLKFRLRWSSLPAVRLHRARCSHALIRSGQRSRRTDEHRHHPRLCQAS